MNRNELLDFLTEEGFRPEQPDEDGRIVFKYQGSTLFINTDDDDPDYVQLGMLATLDAEGRDRQIFAANTITSRFKAGKCVVLAAGDEALVAFTVEAFTGMERFRNVFERWLVIIAGMNSEYGDELRRLEDGGLPDLGDAGDDGDAGNLPRQ